MIHSRFPETVDRGDPDALKDWAATGWIASSRAMTPDRAKTIRHRANPDAMQILSIPRGHHNRASEHPTSYAEHRTRRDAFGARFYFLSPRRRSGERIEERGILTERPSSPGPLLHRMEEREFIQLPLGRAANDAGSVGFLFRRR